MLAVPFWLVFWWIIDFAGFVGLVKTPSVLLGILASVAAIYFSFKKMSSGGGGGKGAQTSYLLPAVAVLAVMMIVRKVAMAEADFAMLLSLCALMFFAQMQLSSPLRFLRGWVSRVVLCSDTAVATQSAVLIQNKKCF